MGEACAMLEPLTFPESSTPLHQFSFIPFESGTCTCPLCNLVFELPMGRDILLNHLYNDHKLIVGDAHLIASTQGYFGYWKVKFSQEPLQNFCTPIILEGGTYFFLSNANEEDSQLRRDLINKRLEWVLDFQKKEREDKLFKRQCLFCRNIDTTSRYEYLSHLSYQHNLQLGKPDNLVFIDTLLDKLEDRLNKLQCIYCEHVFKDRTVLKEHMRKKFHKRIDPRNKEYDIFYIVNYLEESCRNENYYNVEREPEDAWSQWREEGSDWSEWQEKPSPIVCLFCPFTCEKWDDVINHMLVEHKFCYNSTLKKLNFYEQIKIVNYIRREIYLCHCYACDTKFTSRDALLNHMTEQNHFILPEKKNWNHPEFFFPTYENDTFLCLLEDNEEDPVDKLSSQMLNDCSMEGDFNSI